MPLDRAFMTRTGEDVTLVGWGAMLVELEQAAEDLAATGVSAEVIDLATIKPYDRATVRASVEKTGRCVIVHEAPLTGGFGAEIAADLADHCLLALKAPVKRVAGFDTVMPYYRLENHYMPTAARIVGAVREIMEFQ